MARRGEHAVGPQGDLRVSRRAGKADAFVGQPGTKAEPARLRRDQQEAQPRDLRPFLARLVARVKRPRIDGKAVGLRLSAADDAKLAAMSSAVTLAAQVDGWLSRMPFLAREGFTFRDAYRRAVKLNPMMEGIARRAGQLTNEVITRPPT